MDLYSDEDVILYCKGGYRSLIGSYIIFYDGNFTGKIYNMLGGITAWQAAGFPIRNNTPPDTPDISGPAKVSKKTEINYDFSTTDAEDDGVCYFIDWGDGNNETTDYYASAESSNISFNIEVTLFERWTDADGNTWFKAQKSWVNDNAIIMVSEYGKINDSGDTYELIYNVGSQQVDDWEPDNPEYNYLIYYRQ